MCQLYKSNTLMSALEILRHQFQYEFWANRSEISALSELNAPPASAVRLMAHIVAAQGLWLDRLQEKSQPSAVWPSSTLEECASTMANLEADWQSYLSSLADDDLSTRCSYTNSKGELWENNVADILSHVLLHSAYHRGQIALEVRHAGANPAYTDYIHAVRQGLLE